MNEHPSPWNCDNVVVLHDPAQGRWLVFERPRTVLATSDRRRVLPLLRQAERAIRQQGWFAAGFVAYEAAPAFDAALVTQGATDFPLAWFGLFDRVQEMERLPKIECPPASLDWSGDTTEREHAAALRRIKGYIRTGETYQVNYSMRLRARCEADPWLLFRAMAEAQGHHYAAFINTQAWSICSASPELFFRLEAGRLVSRPMKGTAPRGLWPGADAEQGQKLLRSRKNRAENVMIVDMMRNDLGRIARPGSVRVERLFELERYPTLWQMTSTVSCLTRASVAGIFRALFPAASITGAPKVCTMQIIAELETSPRKIYTGAIGFLAPGRLAQFNVAIRTLLVDKRAREAEFGVGGGIVWDSSVKQEYRECQVKTRVLEPQPGPFDLLETMLWRPGSGYFLLEEHLSRLAASAGYFGRKFSPPALRDALTELEKTLSKRPHRVRVTISEAGAISITHQPLAESRAPFRIGLALRPVPSTNPLLYHKSTDRRVYETALAGRSECDDVLLWNERGELTESTIANVVVERRGQLLTPPVRCGLLPGTCRGDLLRQKRIREAVLLVRDCRQWSRIYLVNSVRGMWQVSLGNCSSTATESKKDTNHTKCNELDHG